MASGDLLAQFGPTQLFPDNGPPDYSKLRSVGIIKGLPLNKPDGVTFLLQIEPNNTPLATGLTVEFLMADDPITSSPGAVVRIGATIGPIVSGTTPPTDPATTNEVQASVTIPSMPGAILTASIAVPNANLSGLAAGNFALVHLRRIGSNAADNHPGRPYLLGAVVKDT